MDVQESLDICPEAFVGGHVRKVHGVGPPFKIAPGADLAVQHSGRRTTYEPQEPTHPRLLQILLRLGKVRAFVGLLEDRSVVIGRQAVAGIRRPAGVIPKHLVSHGPHRVAGVHVEIGQAGRELLLEIPRAIEPPCRASGACIIIGVRVVPEVFVLPVVERRRHVVQPIAEDAECDHRHFQPLARLENTCLQLGKTGRNRQGTGGLMVDRQRPRAQVFQGDEQAVFRSVASMQRRPRKKLAGSQWQSDFADTEK